jgi:DNA recombination protein RmuC
MVDAMTIGLLAGAVLVGALLAWLIGRGRVAAQIDAAVARAEAPLQGELAQLRERVRSTEEALRSKHGDFEALQRQADAWRQALDTERDETAKLTERASRVPALEAQVVSAGEQLRAGAAEVLRLSTEVAQKAQAVTSLSEQLAQLEAERTAASAKLDEVTAALNAGNERKATLEEQAARLPGLERKVADSETQLAQLNAQLSELRESNGADLSRLTAEVAAERDAHGLVRGELGVEKLAREEAEALAGRLSGELTELRTRLESERASAEEKLELLVQAKEALSDQFKTLASDILEEKSKRFAEQNQATLGQLLDPLRTQLSEFKGKVEDVYVNESKDRSALAEQVRQLVGLNQALSQDAKNLTHALKGSAKTQGNWGELVLERVLEASGLRKGHEYHVQESQQREDGTRAQADVVINLPEERRLVVDAKVSLTAYEAHIVADTDEERALAMRRHLESVRTHIKGLSGKQYQALYGLKSLDFVLMFVPIEPAFMMAVTNDNDLFMEAWNRNVLLVSPSTLLFVVRTVAHLWRQEAQSRNAQDIAKRGAELYDRLVAFVEDLQMVGAKLKQAQVAFDDAQKKLSTNKGNVIRQAEMLRELGVKPTKALPAPLVELSAVEVSLDVGFGQLALPGEQSVNSLGPHSENESAPAQLAAGS